LSHHQLHVKIIPLALCLVGIWLLISCTAYPQPGATVQSRATETMNNPDANSARGNLMNGPKRTLNIAHRGARSLAPENTLVAARKGLEIGADLWELDVAVTQDGELVVLHDDTPARTSNVADIFPERKTAPAYQFTLAELRQLDFGGWFVKQDPFKQIAAGAVSKADQDKFWGERIPTLRDALTFTRDNHWRVNVEIKDASGTPGDAVVVQKTVALIAELGMVDQVMISSFNHTYIQKVKSLNPAIVTAALVEKADPDPAALLRRTGAQAYNPDVKVITPEVIRSLRGQGFDVYVWTVNDAATMKKLIDAGVSGIFTDYPQLLKTVLEAK
jgi:glycerophosphoryl diester phosphodiesterase